MKKKLLKQAFLLAVCLLTGSASAWAEDTSGKTVVGTTVTETYDFNGWGLANLDKKGEATIGKASETLDHTVGETAVYEITNPVGKASATLELYHRFAMSNPGTGRASKQVLFYNSDKSGGDRASLGGTAVSGYVSILDLPKDATITITNEGGAFTFQSSNVKDSGGTQVTAGETTVTSGETYTVTTAGDVDFSHGTWSGWRKVVIVYEATEEVVTAPTLELTGTNGNNRTITVTNGTSSDGTATLTTYYTTNGNTPTSSSTAVVGDEITVSTSCTIKAITISSAGGESPVTEFVVEAGTPIVLDSPIISRTANTTVSITAPQSVLGTPTTTIYYRIGESGDFAVYSEELTISSHNTVYAYAVASGYGNSATASREIAFVSSFPQASILDKVNTFSSGALDTTGDGIVGTNTTYYPLVIDGEQWGSNIYFQNVTSWGFRSNNTWYNQSAKSTEAWVMFNALNAGDVVVFRMDEGAVALTNATYLPEYSYSGHQAYRANSDGNIELRFMRKGDKGNNVLRGIDLYPNTTFTLSANQAQRLTFHNVGSGSANDQNWMMNVYNDGSKVGVVRADWWDNVAAGNGNFTNPYIWSNDGGILAAGAINWSTFLSDMSNADIDFTISYTGGALYILGTMTKDDNVYYVNYTKTGLSDDVSIYLYGNNAVLSNINRISTEVNTTYTAPSNAIKVTIASSGYSSLASAYGLDFSGVDGLTAYVATKTTTEKVKLTSVEEMPANSGIILKGTPSTTYSIPVKADAAYAGTNLLSAAVEATPIEANTAYILQSGQFHLVTADSKVPAGKAYLLASNVPSGARAMKFVFDDDATAVFDLNDKSEMINDNYYDLQGRRVSQPAKGLYITGGKKIMVK